MNRGGRGLEAVVFAFPFFAWLTSRREHHSERKARRAGGDWRSPRYRRLMVGPGWPDDYNMSDADTETPPSFPSEEPRESVTRSYGVLTSAWVALLLNCTPAALFVLAIMVPGRTYAPMPSSVRTLVVWGLVAFVPALLSLVWASLHASIEDVRMPLPARLAVAGLCASALTLCAIVVMAFANSPFR